MISAVLIALTGRETQLRNVQPPRRGLGHLPAVSQDIEEKTLECDVLAPEGASPARNGRHRTKQRPTDGKFALGSGTNRTLADHAPEDEELTTWNGSSRNRPLPSSGPGAVLEATTGIHGCAPDVTNESLRVSLDHQCCGESLHKNEHGTPSSHKHRVSLSSQF